jgi:hypothetical protein
MKSHVPASPIADGLEAAADAVLALAAGNFDEVGDTTFLRENIPRE